MNAHDYSDTVRPIGALYKENVAAKVRQCGMAGYLFIGFIHNNIAIALSRQ